MKCFYHNETDAAGQCTNCGKFLCLPLRKFLFTIFPQCAIITIYDFI